MAAYYVDEGKVGDIQEELRIALGDPQATFECVFLLDDFCGSGRTLLREVVQVAIPGTWADVQIPASLKGTLVYNNEKRMVEWNYKGQLTQEEMLSLSPLEQQSEGNSFVAEISKKCASRETAIKGSLKRISEAPMMDLVAKDARVFLAPLLATDYAMVRLRELAPRLTSPLGQLEIIPAASISDDVRVRPGQYPDIVQLCTDYYDDSLADKHTSTVRFGYDGCGLPVVLHHNTPNNSVYFLWARKWKDPLFPRFERHGREVGQ